MNAKRYVTTINGSQLALIPKAGSTSIAKIVLFECHPDKVPTLMGAPVGDIPIWQAFVPKSETPNCPWIPVRDPVDRFLSACSQANLAVEEALEILERGDEIDPHFRPVSDFIVEGAKLFRFPEDNKKVSAACGISEIPKLNVSSDKPEITKGQKTRVLELYSNDVNLRDGISED